MKEIKTFGDRLKYLRGKSELTQEELSVIIGVAKRTIEDYEQNRQKNPTADTVFLLADFFHVNPKELLYGGISMDNNILTQAIMEELKQIKVENQLMAIHDLPYNGVQSKLPLSEDLISEMQSVWQKLFSSGLYRTYVQQIILKYCQNRKLLISQYTLRDGLDILKERKGFN